MQLLQGIIVDGAHAVVDKSAAQKHSQGEDPGVIPSVTLEVTREGSLELTLPLILI